MLLFVHRTVRCPDQSHGEEVLQVVEQDVLDPEVLLHPDGARAAGRHHEARAVQAEAG